MGAILFLSFNYYLSNYLIYFLCFITIIQVVLLLYPEKNLKRFIAFASIFHCAVGVLVLCVSDASPYSGFVVIFFFLLHVIHGICAGLLFYYVGSLSEKAYIKSEFLFIESKECEILYLQKFFIILLYTGFPLFLGFFIEVCLFASLVSFSILIVISIILLSNLIFFIFFLYFMGIGIKIRKQFKIPFFIVIFIFFFILLIKLVLFT